MASGWFGIAWPRPGALFGMLLGAYAGVAVPVAGAGAGVRRTGAGPCAAAPSCGAGGGAVVIVAAVPAERQLLHVVGRGGAGTRGTWCRRCRSWRMGLPLAFRREPAVVGVAATAAADLGGEPAGGAGRQRRWCRSDPTCCSSTSTRTCWRAGWPSCPAPATWGCCWACAAGQPAAAAGAVGGRAAGVVRALPSRAARAAAGMNPAGAGRSAWPLGAAGRWSPPFTAPACDNGFVYDDAWTVLDNPVIRDPGNLAAPVRPAADRRPASRRRPPGDAGHARCWTGRCGGGTPPGTTLQNLLWHAAVVLLLFTGLRRLTGIAGDRWRGRRRPVRRAPAGRRGGRGDQLPRGSAGRLLPAGWPCWRWRRPAQAPDGWRAMRGWLAAALPDLLWPDFSKENAASGARSF